MLYLGVALSEYIGRPLIVLIPCLCAPVQALDLATASVLGLTAPLWTAMLGVFTERGSWTRYDTAAAFICVIGVVLILRPAPFFNGGQSAYEVAIVGKSLDAILAMLLRVDSITR